MGVITIREFNANVSQAIARVESGETLDITKHGKIVAELRPKAAGRDATWLAAQGRMMAAFEKGLPLGGEKVTYDDKYGDATS